MCSTSFNINHSNKNISLKRVHDTDPRQVLGSQVDLTRRRWDAANAVPEQTHTAFGIRVTLSDFFVFDNEYEEEDKGFPESLVAQVCLFRVCCFQRIWWESDAVICQW